MSNTYQNLLASLGWLLLTIVFTPIGLELFLFQVSDYNVYRVLNIRFSDLLVLSCFLIIQYLLFKRLSHHFDKVWDISKTFKSRIFFFFPIILVASFLYALIPSQFPFWIFYLLLGGMWVFGLVVFYLAKTPFHKVIFLLLFVAGMNSSMVFWMHEESNGGRHMKYAQQLAEKRDTIAESILQDFGNIGKQIEKEVDKNEFWEKKWMDNAYLASNYRLEIKENISDSSQIFYEPVSVYREATLPTYKVFFPENYFLSFERNKDFRKSIYSPLKPFKNLKDLDDFYFAVIDKSKIILSNSHVFDPYILDVPLPPIGSGEKMNLKGYDVLAYRSSKDVFVLIGEPLSEFQVWTSNFAFMFILFLGIIVFAEIIRIFLSKKNFINSWQEQPIQYRIQMVLIGTTCLLFFIIAGTTFLFLDQKNSVISDERMRNISSNLQDEIEEEQEQYGWQLKDFSTTFLFKLADRKRCDIDLYAIDGTLLTSSFASAQNTPSPKTIEKKIIQQIKRNVSLTVVEKLEDKKTLSPYFRTYAGVFQQGVLQGIVSTSSFESEIGTSSNISIVMEKLLNVYVFLLLFSWGGGLLLIRLLTKPLKLLANRLSDFKLGQKNEKLNWQGDDVIGQLILKYNMMVDQVEQTTQELIQNEREGAWQIMAQQIAHEINNKLTPLRLNIQFLTRIVKGMNQQESETIKRITDGLVEKIDRLSRTASQFKLFASLDDLKVRSVELTGFFQHFLYQYNKQQEFEYLLNIEVKENINPTINIDLQHLYEVLNNILSNAENAIADTPRGSISIHLKVENDQAIIEIKDNGTGINEDLIKVVFDPKFSVTSSKTGLGLPICKRIIEFYGGTINFTTQTGVGTSFVIHFPLAAPIQEEKEIQLLPDQV